MSTKQAEEAWAALRGVTFDGDFVVTQLVVYEEVGTGWHEAARPPFGMDAV